MVQYRYWCLLLKHWDLSSNPTYAIFMIFMSERHPVQIEAL
jgi:hypothetical protein